MTRSWCSSRTTTPTPPASRCPGPLVGWSPCTGRARPGRSSRNELQQAITRQTKAILLNSPHNPTGKVFSTEELEYIADLARVHDLIVITDEVYEHLVFDGRARADRDAARAAERTVTISSAGKTFSVTGWKIGWIVGHRNW